jgi:hypothetical protein
MNEERYVMEPFRVDVPDEVLSDLPTTSGGLDE